jgi:ABC-type Mn2+/Zn2+ transport system ATPase subunit
MSGGEGTPALELVDLGVELAGRSVLEGVSLRVESAEFLCLLGPNGGGKTTLLRAVLGLVPLASGRVELLGEPLARRRARIGYLPQRKGFAEDFPATPAELIAAALRGAWPWRVRRAERERAETALERVGARELIDRPLAGLSGGQTQRVFLARALAIDPPLLLIDEPLAGLDPEGRDDFLSALARIGEDGRTAAIVVTHEPETVSRFARRVAYLDGRLAAVGPPESVLGDPQLHAAAFAGADHTRTGH